MTSGLTLGAYYDRPHNKIIEVLLYSGIIGLIAYLSIFIIIFYLLFKHKISGGIILAAFFLCYFFQNIFLFDTTATYILFFLIAGFINNSFPGKTIATMVNPQHLQKNRGVLALKIISAGLIFLLIADVMYEINIKPTVAAMYFAVPVGLNTANKKIFSGYEKAISMNTIYDSDLMLEFTSKSFYLLGGGYANTFKQEVINALINMEPFLYKDIEIYHRQVNHSYQWLVAIDEQKYVSDKNTNDLNEMENTLKQAIAFNPNVPAYYGFDGELKILRGDYKGGEAEIKKDCDMNGCQPADLYKKIGSAYEDKGDKQEEMKNYQKALDIYLNNQGAVKPGTLVQFINYVGTKYCQELHDLKNCSRTFTQGANALPEYADILTQRFNQLTEIK
jgi:tetratricopeptide (TPR) repeat protein